MNSFDIEQEHYYFKKFFTASVILHIIIFVLLGRMFQLDEIVKKIEDEEIKFHLVTREELLQPVTEKIKLADNTVKTRHFDLSSKSKTPNSVKRQSITQKSLNRKLTTGNINQQIQAFQKDIQTNELTKNPTQRELDVKINKLRYLKKQLLTRQQEVLESKNNQVNNQIAFADVSLQKETPSPEINKSEIEIVKKTYTQPQPLESNEFLLFDNKFNDQDKKENIEIKTKVREEIIRNKSPTDVEKKSLLDKERIEQKKSVEETVENKTLEVVKNKQFENVKQDNIKKSAAELSTPKNTAQYKENAKTNNIFNKNIEYKEQTNDITKQLNELENLINSIDSIQQKKLVEDNTKQSYKISKNISQSKSKKVEVANLPSETKVFNDNIKRQEIQSNKKYITDNMKQSSKDFNSELFDKELSYKKEKTVQTSNLNQTQETKFNQKRKSSLLKKNLFNTKINTNPLESQNIKSDVNTNIKVSNIRVTAAKTNQSDLKKSVIKQNQNKNMVTTNNNANIKKNLFNSSSNYNENLPEPNIAQTEKNDIKRKTYNIENTNKLLAYNESNNNTNLLESKNITSASNNNFQTNKEIFTSQDFNSQTINKSKIINTSNKKLKGSEIKKVNANVFSSKYDNKNESVNIKPSIQENANLEKKMPDNPLADSKIFLDNQNQSHKILESKKFNNTDNNQKIVTSNIGSVSLNNESADDNINKLRSQYNTNNKKNLQVNQKQIKAAAFNKVYNNPNENVDFTGQASKQSDYDNSSSAISFNEDNIKNIKLVGNQNSKILKSQPGNKSGNNNKLIAANISPAAFNNSNIVDNVNKSDINFDNDGKKSLQTQQNKVQSSAFNKTYGNSGEKINFAKSSNQKDYVNSSSNKFINKKNIGDVDIYNNNSGADNNNRVLESKSNRSTSESASTLISDDFNADALGGVSVEENISRTKVSDNTNKNNHTDNSNNFNYRSSENIGNKNIFSKKTNIAEDTFGSVKVREQSDAFESDKTDVHQHDLSGEDVNIADVTLENAVAQMVGIDITKDYSNSAGRISFQVQAKNKALKVSPEWIKKVLDNTEKIFTEKINDNFENLKQKIFETFNKNNFSGGIEFKISYKGVVKSFNFAKSGDISKSNRTELIFDNFIKNLDIKVSTTFSFNFGMTIKFSRDSSEPDLKFFW